MAAAVNYSSKRTALSTLGIATQPTAPIAADRDFTSGPDAQTTATAMWMNETVVGQLADNMQTRGQYNGAKRDPYFNPYVYYADNKKTLDEETPYLEQFVLQGDFHGVQSEEEFIASKDALKREMERRDAIANGNGFGMAVGMALSFADVTTAIPVVGQFSKVGTIGKIGIGALNAFGQTAATEAFLQKSQYARTFHESLMNVGIGTALGGGMGAFGAMISKKGGELDPMNPGNPLVVQNRVPTITQTSLGSAASAETAVEYAENTGIGLLDRAGRAMGTPTSVALDVAKVDPEAAAVMENIARTGIVTKGHEQGVPEFANDAEAIFDVDYQSAYLATAEDLDEQFHQMNIELGGKFTRAKEFVNKIPGAKRVVGENPVTTEAWQKHIVMRLNDPEYKTGNAILDKWVGQAADSSKKFFDKMFDRGVQHGLFTQEQKLDNYFVQRWQSHMINQNPKEFESWLLSKFLKEPDEDWLKESFEMSKADFDKLPDTLAGLTDVYKTATGERLEVPAGTKPSGYAEPVTINRTKREVLQAWDEDNHVEASKQADLDAQAAQHASEDADFRFRSLFREARRIEKGEGEAKLMEAKAVVREQEANLNLMRQERARMEEERQLLSVMADRARRTTTDRVAEKGVDETKLSQLEEALGQRPVGSSKPEALSMASLQVGEKHYEGRSHADAMSEALKAGESEDLVSEAFLNGQHGYMTTHGNHVNEEQALQLAHHAGQMKPHDMVLTSDALINFPRKRERLTKSEMATKIEERAKTLSKSLGRMEKEIQKAEERLDKLAVAAAERTQAASYAKMARKQAAAQLKLAKSGKKYAAAQARKTANRSKRLSTRKTVSQQAADITRTLQNRGEVPHGMMLFSKGSEDKITASGRVKHRGIDLSPGDLNEAIAKGWIDTNVNNIMHAYTRDVGGRLAMLEKFGSVDLKPQIQAIQEKFATLKEAAPNAKARQELAALEKKALDTVRVLRDRVLGTEGIPSDPESAVLYASRVMRKANFLRYMGGPMLSSITDGATSALSNGGFGKTLMMFGKALSGSIKKHAEGLADRELRAVIFGSENSLMFSRHAKNMGIEDLQWIRGFGAGNTRKVSAAVEGAMNAGTETLSVVNGMTWWNSRMRYIAAQCQLANIVRDTEKLLAGGKLDQARTTEYARFGMDADTLKEVGDLIKTHGSKNEAGLWDPNAQAWEGDRGAELRRRMLILLKRAAQEAVVAPTAADLPPFMSSTLGHILFQFQTFGFASVNKYVRNLRYKAVNGQAFDALMSVTWAMAMGAGAYALKERVVKGNELSDKPGQWVYEAVDRSGLVGWMSPYMNAGLKLGAPAMKSLGVDFLEQPSRYRAATWYSALLGPSVGLADDTFGAMTSLAQGDLDSAGTKAARLVPFRNLFYIEALWRRAHGLAD